MAFDRPLKPYEIKHVIRDFYEFQKVIVKGYTKKRKTPQGHTEKRPFCPSVLYAADILAHRIGENPVSAIFEDPRFVPTHT